ncbi:hypothetical protein [Streptomyces sp. NPDC016845]|uniref:hypothetical protein n=1 Tax=Streptomyces sp. NPDC016845 TaxID=3364972 RepID=UPI0037A11277
MALQFIGIDNGSGQTGSPTVWVDPRTADVVIQSYLADEETRAECVENTAPGHAKGIPSHEGVLRVPGHLIHLLREACDAAERAAQLHRPA